MASRALGALVGQPLRLRSQSSIPHHDESPVHVITTAAVSVLEQPHDGSVDAARFRRKIMLEVDGVDFIDDCWKGPPHRAQRTEVLVGTDQHSGVGSTEVMADHQHPGTDDVHSGATEPGAEPCVRAGMPRGRRGGVAGEGKHGLCAHLPHDLHSGGEP